MMESTDQVRRCPVAEGAESHPHCAALRLTDGTGLTYSELDYLIRICTSSLKRCGMSTGSRVAIVSPTSVNLIAFLFACFRLGAVAAPLSLRLPRPALESRLHQLKPDLVVHDSDIDTPEGIRAMPLVSLLDGTSRDESDDWRLPDPATIVFTSGSTGDAKAVLHSLGNHVHNALGSNTNIPVRPGDSWLLALPLYHVGGLAILFRCFLAGAAVALPDPEASLSETLTNLRPTHVSLVATQLNRIIDDDLPGSLRAVLLGGSTIPSDLIDRAHHQGIPIHTSYGMSEMASQVTTTPPGADRETLATSGLVLPDREVRVSDGRILVRGATRFLGYVDGTSVETPFDSEGWFETGDTGYFDARNRLVVTGRVDDMFVSGGENIQPREIERALCAIEGISDAVVVPVPDAEFGRRPVAFLVCDGSFDEQEVARRLRSRLAGFMVPRSYYPLPADSQRSLKRDRRILIAEASRLEGMGEVDDPDT